jgi:Beta protein
VIPNYLPILKAKAGEFDALKHLPPNLFKQMHPLFEISRISSVTRNKKSYASSSAIVCDYLADVASEICKASKGGTILVDMSQWDPDLRVETGEHAYSYLCTKLMSDDLKVIPVVGYDRWDSDEYRQALQNFDDSAIEYYCIRLDSHAVEDALEPSYFGERMQEILKDLGVNANKCAVLIDHEDMTNKPLELLLEDTSRIMEVIGVMNFRFIATSGCSLPNSINLAVKDVNSSGKVFRSEMLLWKTLRSEYPKHKWIFGDYGVRGPSSAEDVVAPDANGKIRYTTHEQFHIERGHSRRKGEKGAQMYKLARNITQSSHFMGSNFSWGDSQIVECSHEKFKGNLANWIAIDTNHHMTYVMAEIREFVLNKLRSGDAKFAMK